MRRYLRPQPRLELSAALLAHASAAMDVSDGLAKDLERMARASGVQATLDARRIPLSVPAQKIAGQVAEWRLKVATSGDDYEVLCAVPEAQAAAFVAAAQQARVDVMEIGAFSAGQGLSIVGPDGQAVVLDRTGWDHF